MKPSELVEVLALATEGERIAVLEAQIRTISGALDTISRVHEQISEVSGQIQVLHVSMQNAESNAVQSRMLVAETLKEMRAQHEALRLRVDAIEPEAEKGYLRRDVAGLKSWRARAQGVGAAVKLAWALALVLVGGFAGALFAHFVNPAHH